MEKGKGSYNIRNGQQKACSSSDVCRLTARFSNTKLVIDAAVLHVRHPNTRNQTFFKARMFPGGCTESLTVLCPATLPAKCLY